MAPYLKSEAPEDFRETVQKIEDSADLCYKNLSILSAPRDLATWAVLTWINVNIERAIASKGFASQSHSNAMLNLSRGGAQLIKWICEHGSPELVGKSALKWQPPISQMVEAALPIAIHYGAFTNAFPLWHKCLLRAELTEQGCVKFISRDGPQQRRVMAYHQGIRPNASRPEERSSLALSPETQAIVNRKIANLVANASGNQMTFSYGRPSKLWRQLYEEYYKLLESHFRRDDKLQVSTYTLRDFRSIYASLLAVCGVHDLACHWRGQMTGTYPLNSAVLMLAGAEWTKTLTKITSLPNSVVEAAINDLTFGTTKTLDFFVHPFIPLSKESKFLAVLPHFPLKSKVDENIIRVSSHVRPKLHDALTKAKEDEMRGQLQQRLSTQFHLHGPKSLPSGLPDIDLIVEGKEIEATALVSELKWLRQTMRSTEIPERQKEFLIAVDQLTKVKNFLDANPEYLSRIGGLSKPLGVFNKTYFAIIARDYFIWLDPQTSFAVIDYDEFIAQLAKSETLVEAMEILLRFDWLPVECRDFVVRYDKETVNGACVETEAVYPTY